MPCLCRRLIVVLMFKDFNDIGRSHHPIEISVPISPVFAFHKGRSLCYSEYSLKDCDIAVFSPPSRNRLFPFKKIMELYHQICVSYPRIEDIDGERKKAVAARWRKYGDIAVFEQVFRIAQASSFMKGENGRNWHADFDWMMRPTNISKILEHKYDDKPTAQTGQPTGALGVLARMREECDE